jgi:hypothetical protein
LKLLLDECVDRRLAAHLTGLSVRTVADMGWPGIKNGQLLALAQSEFDIFVTVNRNLIVSAAPSQIFCRRASARGAI